MEKAAAIRGDRSGVHAIERLFREEGRRLWRALVAFTGGRREIADDAMAEAFARALHHVDSIRQPKPWIYATAFRLAARDLRRERKEREGAGASTTEPPAEVDEVMDALRGLSANQRAAMVLHYYVDLPVREVARALSITPATVKVHLFRGRRRLRALLGGEEERDG